MPEAGEIASWRRRVLFKSPPHSKFDIRNTKFLDPSRRNPTDQPDKRPLSPTRLDAPLFSHRLENSTEMAGTG
jgi:hypothetical protein